MPRNPFNKSASGPEKRLLPYSVEDGKTPDETWVTSQVFRPQGWKNRKNRSYYAATLKPGPETGEKVWEIGRYSYTVQGGQLKSSHLADVKGSFERVIRNIMQLEKDHCSYEPVPGLAGNYREVAKLCSTAYFDDHGSFVPVKKSRPVTGDALLTREKLDLLYQKPGRELEASVISTWDDFYREVVNKVPLTSETPVSKGLHARAKDLRQKIKGGSLSSPSELRSTLAGIKALPIADADGTPDFSAHYQYNVMILAALMRAGGEAYDKFSMSFSAAPETLKLLSEIGSIIDGFAQKGLALSPEQGKQLANVIMQGPDPYADKPLPLEAVLSAEAAKKKAAPRKPHSP